MARGCASAPSPPGPAVAAVRALGLNYGRRGVLPRARPGVFGIRSASRWPRVAPPPASSWPRVTGPRAVLAAFTARTARIYNGRGKGVCERSFASGPGGGSRPGPSILGALSLSDMPSEPRPVLVAAERPPADVPPLLVVTLPATGSPPCSPERGWIPRPRAERGAGPPNPSRRGGLPEQVTARLDNGSGMKKLLGYGPRA